MNVSSSTKAKLKYASDNKKIVKVNSKGYITLQGIGKAVVTVTAPASGNYTVAKRKVVITVKPKKPMIRTLKSRSAAKVNLSWEKVSKAGGYQVRYSMSKSMKSAKMIRMNGVGKTSSTLKKLKKGKKYYFQVRAYKKLGKNMYYSEWSNKKSVKVKK